MAAVARHAEPGLQRAGRDEPDVAAADDEDPRTGHEVAGVGGHRGLLPCEQRAAREQGGADAEGDRGTAEGRPESEDPGRVEAEREGGEGEDTEHGEQPCGRAGRTAGR